MQKFGKQNSFQTPLTVLINQLILLTCTHFSALSDCLRLVLALQLVSSCRKLFSLFTSLNIKGFLKKGSDFLPTGAIFQTDYIFAVVLSATSRRKCTRNLLIEKNLVHCEKNARKIMEFKKFYWKNVVVHAYSQLFMETLI